MNMLNFKKTRLTLAISLLLGAGTAPLAMAEEAEQAATDDVEVISVKGIRGSYMRASDMKRENTGVVDGISAEELGKFPDTNLAESLGRITGISISRSGGEGSQITARGFGPEFNLITLNGRQMPGTGNSRSYDLNNLSPEGVSALEVMKTARADMPTGGLGATVNIKTTKPLSSPGLRFSVMGKGIHDSSVKDGTGDDVTPEISAVLSNTFLDETLGVAFTLSHQRRDYHQEGASVQGWMISDVDPLYHNFDLDYNAREINPFTNTTPDDLDPNRVVDNRATFDTFEKHVVAYDADGNVVTDNVDATDDFGNYLYTKVVEYKLDESGQKIPITVAVPSYYPRDMNYSVEEVERSKTNGQLTLQWAPIDNLVATVDYTFTDVSAASTNVGWGIWNEIGSNIRGVELDKNGTALFLDTVGGDGSFASTRVTTEVDAKSIGFNLDWQVTDSLNLNLDYHDSSNEVDNGGDKQLGSSGQIILGSPELEYKWYDYRDTGDIPHFGVQWNNGTEDLLPGEIDHQFNQFIHSPGKSEIEQLQFKGVWESPFDSPLIDVRFGFSKTDQTMSGSSAWSGLLGLGWNPSYTASLPDELFTKESVSNILEDINGGGSDLSPGYYYSFDYDEVMAYLMASVPGLTVGAYGGAASAPAYAKVTEETTSAYVSTSLEFDVFSDMYLNVNAGVRYESTDVSSPGIVSVVDQVVWAAPTEWLTQYEKDENGDAVTVKENFTGEHDLWLPMLDLKLDITDDLVARASWGKTMARAPLGNLVGSLSLTGSPKLGSRTGGAGNTDLQPFVSTNLDFSFEYYYSEGSHAAVGLFRKEVKNFISNGKTPEQYEGINDIFGGPRYIAAEAALQESTGGDYTTGDIYDYLIAQGVGVDGTNVLPMDDDPIMTWTISRPVNSDTKTVDGIEIAWQHLFGDSGYGFSANATFVDGDVEFETENLNQQAPLNGISDSTNFQLFYEKDGLSVKGTYTWRDSFLIGVGQSQGTADNPPQYAKAYEQFDLSVNYDVTDRLTVFLEGVNLNNETEEGYGRYEEQFLFARQYGPRYALGARYTFD